MPPNLEFSNDKSTIRSQQDARLYCFVCAVVRSCYCFAHVYLGSQFDRRRRLPGCGVVTMASAGEEFSVDVGCYSLRFGAIVDEFVDFRYHAINGRYGSDATFFPTSVEENHDQCIRLGMDFIKNLSKFNFVGEEYDGEEMSYEIAEMLATQITRIVASVEVQVQQLAINRVKMHHYGDPKVPNDRAVFSLYCEGEDIRRALILQFRQGVIQAYKVGKAIGFECGQAVLRAMYGSQPASTKVYEYTEERNNVIWPKYTRRNGVLVCQQVRVLPICVYTMVQREEQYKSKKRELDRRLHAAELSIIEQVVCRVRFLLDRGGKEHATRMFESNEIQFDIQEFSHSCVHSAFDLGRFDGYDCGQHALKMMYGYYPEDDKIYTFSQPSDPHRIVLDLGDDTKTLECHCGHCFHCIERETQQECARLRESLQQTKATVDEFLLRYHDGN